MTPQHLQQLDRFHEGQLRARLDGIHTENWGVLSMELDLTALEAGMVALSGFAGVLPDGTPISFDAGSREAPSSRPVEGYFEAHQAVLEVYVGIGRPQEARNNVAENKGGPTRYFSATEVVHDRYGQAEPQELDLACPNLRLLFGSEPREDSSAIKVAEVKRSGAGKLVVADDYIPPCLRASASPALRGLIERLLTSMNARRGALAQGVRHRDGASAEFTAADVTRFLLLSAINAHIPVLKHLAVAGDLSPKATYLFLCQLAGALATFSADFDPNDLPKFVYEDLRSTFGILTGVIEGFLQATMEARYITVPLVSQGDGLFLGEIADDRFNRCKQVVMGVESSVPEAEVSSTLPRLTKLASGSDIEAVLATAVSGVELHATMKPPPQIPTRAGTSYFVVRSEGTYWQNILVERKVAMYLPRSFAPAATHIQLFGVLD